MMKAFRITSREMIESSAYAKEMNQGNTDLLMKSQNTRTREGP